MRFFPANYLYNETFAYHSFITRICIMYITILLIRCKYYFAWSFSKASCITAGVNVVSATNVNIYKVETATNLRTVLSNWNICSANWLKQYVYMRVIEEKYSTTAAIFMTNLVSAFWHGFYPGYYLTFFSSGLLTELGKSIRKKITPIFSDSNYLYAIACNISVMLMLSYMAIPFQVFGIYETYYAWKNLYFVGHVAMTVVAFIVYMAPNTKTISEIIDSSQSMKENTDVNQFDDVTTEPTNTNTVTDDPNIITENTNIDLLAPKKEYPLQSNTLTKALEITQTFEPTKPFLSKRNTDDEILLLSKLRKRNVEKNDN